MIRAKIVIAIARLFRFDTECIKDIWGYKLYVGIWDKPND